GRLTIQKQVEHKCRGRRTPSSSFRTRFDDLWGKVYRASSQAGPGNDINAGSPGFQKAPTRGPASLVAISRSMPSGGAPCRSSVLRDIAIVRHTLLRSDTTIEAPPTCDTGAFGIVW